VFAQHKFQSHQGTHAMYDYGNNYDGETDQDGKNHRASTLFVLSLHRTPGILDAMSVGVSSLLHGNDN
jgi:hypothetical protein